MTSSASFCSRNTRASTVLRANGSALLIERGAITRSERGRALQNSTWPSARSAEPSASPANARTSPEMTRPLQVPQTPLRQEKGTSRPARWAASSTDSFGSQGKWNSLSATAIWNVIATRSLHPPLEGEGRTPERSEGERGGVSFRGQGSPHPGSHLALLDASPTLPLQGRVKRARGNGASQRQRHQRVDARGIAHRDTPGEFQIGPHGAIGVEIKAGREDAGLAVVHDAHHHERRLALGLVAAVLQDVRQTEDVT